MGASIEKRTNDIKSTLKLATEMNKRGFKTEGSELKEVARKKAHKLVQSMKPKRKSKKAASKSTLSRSQPLNFY